MSCFIWVKSHDNYVCVDSFDEIIIQNISIDQLFKFKWRQNINTLMEGSLRKKHGKFFIIIRRFICILNKAGKPNNSFIRKINNKFLNKDNTLSEAPRINDSNNTAPASNITVQVYN